MMKFVFFRGCVLFCATLFFLFTGCEREQMPTSNTTTLPSGSHMTRDYRLRPMDVVRFEMFAEPDNRGDLRVSADGNITLYLLGAVKVARKTLSEAKEMIEKSYKERGIYRNPQVSLQVISYAERRVYIRGYVAAPGPILMPNEEDLTLAKAIDAARGVLPRASRTNVTVTRVVDGTERKWVIDYKAILEGEAPDIPLEEGDAIYVPDSKI